MIYRHPAPEDPLDQGDLIDGCPLLLVTGFNPDDPLDAYAGHDETASAAAGAGTAGIERTEAGSGDPLGARLQTERRQLLDRALQVLPEEQRVVFLLREEGELSLLEAAQTLGVPYETARSRYRYALARLREHFSVTVRRAR